MHIQIRYDAHTVNHHTLHTEPDISVFTPEYSSQDGSGVGLTVYCGAGVVAGEKVWAGVGVLEGVKST